MENKKLVKALTEANELGFNAVRLSVESGADSHLAMENGKYAFSLQLKLKGFKKFAMVMSTVAVLTACSTVPAGLAHSKAVVDSQYTYSYRLTGIEKEYFRKEDGTANCTKFALEYQELAGGVVRACKLPDGSPHRVLDVDGWRLDNRVKYVMRVQDSDCK